MNIKEIATLFGVKEKDSSMKNKEKAINIMEKILQCPKCKGTMRWIYDTNICICDSCTYKVNKPGKKDEKETLNVCKYLHSKNKKFLEDNYHYVDESEGV